MVQYADMAQIRGWENLNVTSVCVHLIWRSGPVSGNKVSTSRLHPGLFAHLQKMECTGCGMCGLDSCRWEQTRTGRRLKVQAQKKEQRHSLLD